MRPKRNYDVEYADIARFVRAYHAERGYPTTIREIVAALPRYKSTSHVWKCVHGMTTVKFAPGHRGVVPA